VRLTVSDLMKVIDGKTLNNVVKAVTVVLMVSGDGDINPLVKLVTQTGAIVQEDPATSSMTKPEESLIVAVY
jgi:hypothetical protein